MLLSLLLTLLYTTITIFIYYLYINIYEKNEKTNVNNLKRKER